MPEMCDVAGRDIGSMRQCDACNEGVGHFAISGRSLGGDTGKRGMPGRPSIKGQNVVAKITLQQDVEPLLHLRSSLTNWREFDATDNLMQRDYRDPDNVGLLTVQPINPAALLASAA